MTNEQRLVDNIAASPRVMQVLRIARAANLPDWRLVAGSIYGTVWNALTNRHPDHGIKDYDLCYFDPDTSWEAEDAIIKAVAALTPPDLLPLVEVRNQARVHLWFSAKFGGNYPALSNTDEALTRYLCYSDAVAARLEADDSISVAAPFGLDDIFKLTMRPNPGRGTTDNRAAKVASVQARWPEVKYKEDEDAPNKNQTMVS
jgi:uncharacterized protein